uniref:Ig-like domain-containing protein n=1 Tax=Amphilophus citrinellus TaxID=61819 RepID=A0A3Q0S361_AMPCI
MLSLCAAHGLAPRINVRPPDALPRAPSPGLAPSWGTGTEVTKTEGQPVTLTCSYETTYTHPELHWYRYHSDLQATQFILWKGGKLDTTEYIPNRRQYGSQTTDTSATLTIKALTLADTALYYCALRNTVIQSVEEAVQKPEHRYVTTLQRGGKSGTEMAVPERCTCSSA